MNPFLTSIQYFSDGFDNHQAVIVVVIYGEMIQLDWYFFQMG